ncbi:DUF357 domain-containing protein [Pyrofollis japonicus]|uniref:DUF357 domain-containing protein n=1 Tax=Pyrofollis japonicus TaxID=3060460 RepID=UPI00295B3EA2|nr:DUF357 domain-containing protein [Pyrofollis japonicus]BEP18282.1 DUF357 domain-containing protein [Pyrofollis japonicus]
MVSLEEVEPSKRVEVYIANVEAALDKVKNKVSDPSVKHVVELVERYIADAKYYLEKGDVFTALADIAYAEGLLDALRWLGIVEFEWKKPSELLSRPKVVVAGTFDLIHPGHIGLLREAWRLGRVYAIVARDESVRKMKGREPIVPEEQRLQVVSAIRYVYSARLGSKTDFLEPLREIKPDIVLLGPDQWADEEWLQKRLEAEGIRAKVLRLKERIECPLCSSTAIACRALRVIPRELCNKLEVEED